MTEDEVKMKQVADQCRVVAHLARTIAEVHEDKAEIFASGAMSTIVEMNGKSTAELMEMLGNVTNGMDIVMPEDAWVNPIFAEAQRRWPQ